MQRVKLSLENPGEHYVGVISLMPGLKNVELVEEGEGYVTIRTNEGLMKRTNISKLVEPDRVVVELDEEYREWLQRSRISLTSSRPAAQGSIIAR